MTVLDLSWRRDAEDPEEDGNMTSNSRDSCSLDRLSRTFMLLAFLALSEDEDGVTVGLTVGVYTLEGPEESPDAEKVRSGPGETEIQEQSMESG